MIRTEAALKIYKSSAGSGKTTTLVYEYLSLILQEPEKFSRILGITFTNKAANEMKGRIVDYLSGLTNPDNHNQMPENMKQKLVSSLKKSNKDISTQAEICLNKILHSYSDFAVSTIDSFVYKIIRTFSRDLNLSWDFDVELETDDLFSQIIDMLMEEFGKDKFLSNQLMALVEEKLNEGKSWRIEKEILDFSKKLLDSDTNPKYISSILEADNTQFEKLRKTFYSENQKLLAEAKKAAQKAIWLLENQGLSYKDLAYGKSGIGNHLRVIAEENAEAVFETKPRTETALDEKKLYAKSAPDELKARIDEISEEVIACGEKLRAIRQHAPDYFSRDAIYRTLYVLAILKSIKSKYEEIKEDNSILPITEFSRSIAQVTLSEDIPYIYERLGEKYQHFFIDEFQDTSTLQWENILPLIENALASNNFNLIVGDVKQAIYRFRGGNIDQLGRMPEPPENINSPLSLNRYEAIKQNAQLEELNTNYRSKNEIIDFNNLFFSFVKQQINPKQKEYYEKVTQQHSREDNYGGQVQIFLKEKEDHFEKTLELIQQIVEDGYELEDIAILCRKNKQAQEMAVYLLEQNIKNQKSGATKRLKVISDESLTLKQSAAVNTLISFARLLINPNDSVQKANILQYIIEKKQLLHHNTYTKQDIRKTNIEDILNNLGYNITLNNIQKYDLYNFFEHIASRLNMDSLNNPYIQFFLDEVLNFTKNKKVPTFHEFIKWWDHKGQNKSIISPEGSDAVQVKTIHKSKGLAFPVVIFPFAAEEVTITRHADYKWVDTKNITNGVLKSGLVKLSSKLEQSCFHETYNNEVEAARLDMINTLYVCMTRPRERLYIISERVEQKKMKNNNDNLKSLKHLFTAYFDSLNISEDVLAYPDSLQPRKHENINRKKTDGSESFYNYNRNKDWASRLLIRKPSTINLIKEQSPQSEGSLIHDLMAQIKYRDDLPAIHKIIDDKIHQPELAKALKTKIEQIVSHPQLTEYFEQNEDEIIRNEAEIVSKDSILRPDRINVRPDKIIIIDYKTGKSEQKHETQIRNYAYSLNAMYPASSKCLLVYIDDEIRINEVI